MKTYQVKAHETVFYTFKIKAKNKDEAWDDALNMDTGDQNIIDSSDFEVESVEEIIPEKSI